MMQGFCESAIRCLCSCLISKNSLSYSDVNEEHHEFMKPGEQLEEEHRSQLAHKDYLDPPAASVANKLSDLLYDQVQPDRLPESAPLGEPSSFSSAMGEDHPYYALFRERLSQLQGIFEVPADACSAQPQTAYPLRLHCYQEGKLNTFKYFFSLPTDWQSYEAVSRDYELQRRFDGNIEEFKEIFETPSGDAKMVYLCYKKVLIMSSRDFYYVRYTFRRGQEHWVLCLSDPGREEVRGRVRGELFTATRVVPTAEGIEVSVSSTTDMKIPIKLQIAKNRGFAEIRKYLDKVHGHLSSEEGRSIL